MKKINPSATEESRGRGHSRWLSSHPFILGVLSVAISVFLTALGMVAIYPHFRGWPGSDSFARIARHLLEDGLFSADGAEPTIERMPLYPFILTAAFRLGGVYWQTCALAFNGSALIICGGLATWLTAKIFDNPCATWACALLLSFHVALVIEALAFRETVWFSLALLGLVSVLTGSSGIGFSRLFLAGVTVGAAYLLRPTGFMLILSVPFWLWRIRKALSVRLSIAIPFVFVVVGAIIAPWQLYAFRIHGHLVLSNSEGGNNFLKGVIPEFWEVTPWLDYDVLDPWLIAKVKEDRDMWSYEVDGYWRAKSIEYIRASPMAWIGKSFVKVAMLFSPVSVPLGYGEVAPYNDTVRRAHFKLDPWIFVSMPSVILILAGAAVQLLRTRDMAVSELSLRFGTGAMIVLIVAIHSVTVSETRYRLPIDPLMAVAASPVVVRWSTVIRSRLR